MTSNRTISSLLRVLATALFVAALPAQQDTYSVYVLAGQSNMEGKAQNVLWEHQCHDDATSAFFAPFRNDDNTAWVERDDVVIDYLGRRGSLTLGYGSNGRTGLEFAFGLRVGDAHDEPVLLIKAAWGGRSLVRDFRPPSAGMPAKEVLDKQLADAQKRVQKQNEKNNKDAPLPTMADIEASYGKDYRAMLEQVRRALAEAGQHFPQLKGRTPELRGFVWFQGWNDQYGGAEQEYEANLKAFIHDVRKDLGAPELPFVIGVMGQNGKEPAKGAMKTIQDAQLAVAADKGMKKVAAVRTDELEDEVAAKVYPGWKDHFEEWQKVGSDHRYHYLGSAIWYSRIGYALADATLAFRARR